MSISIGTHVEAYDGLVHIVSGENWLLDQWNTACLLFDETSKGVYTTYQDDPVTCFRCAVYRSLPCISSSVTV